MFLKHILFILTGLHDAADDLGGGLDDLDILEEGNKDEDKDTKDEDKDEDKEDDDEKVDEDEDEDEDKEESEDEDEDKPKDEDDKDDEEDEDDTEENRITHVSDLKKAYPDIFKKFPDVKAALYRDQAYSEFFANPKEAEAASIDSSALRNIEHDLLENGDPTKLLGEIKKGNQESFNKVALAVLPYLQSADKELYLKVASVPIKQLLRAMIRKFPDAKSNEHKSAHYVHRFFFDDIDIDGKADGEVDSKEDKPKAQKEYEERLEKLNTRDMNNFVSAVDTSYIAKMTKEFRSGIDNDERLSEWAKTKLIEDGLINIRKQLDADPRWQRTMKSLIAQAKTSEYSNDFKSRIVSTALARAKSLIPTVRAKLLAEAVGKGKSKPKDKDDKGDKKVVNFTKKDKEKDNRTQSKKPLTDLDILQGRG